MRLVVDTNVIVSGLLTRRGKPGQIVDRILDGRICVIYSAEILHEYREVLARDKFPFDPQEVTDFLDASKIAMSRSSPPHHRCRPFTFRIHPTQCFFSWPTRRNARW